MVLMELSLNQSTLFNVVALLVWPAEAPHRLSPALQVRLLSAFLAKIDGN